MNNVDRHIRNRYPKTIKALLAKAGYPTLTAVAAHIHRPRSLVSEVIHATAVSAPVAEAVAALIGSTAADLWPRIYGPSTSASIPKAS